MTNRSCGLSHESDLGGVSSEEVDVRLDPAESSTLCGVTGSVPFCETVSSARV
jgi:hypothetical protein